jgi:hypothetical protein
MQQIFLTVIMPTLPSAISCSGQPQPTLDATVPEKLLFLDSFHVSCFLGQSKFGFPIDPNFSFSFHPFSIFLVKE